MNRTFIPHNTIKKRKITKCMIMNINTSVISPHIYQAKTQKIVRFIFMFVSHWEDRNFNFGR